MCPGQAKSVPGQLVTIGDEMCHVEIKHVEQPTTLTMTGQ